MIADATGIGAIAGLATAIIGGVMWFIQRRATKTDLPANRVEKEKQQDEKAIADGTAGERLDSQLDRLSKPENH